MKSSIEIIRFTFKLSLLCGIATYLVTVNIETNFLSFHTAWISNNFALTICGGITTSILVVLLSEIQKYFHSKNSSEFYLFYHAVYLHNALFLLQQNILEYIENTNAIVPENLCEMRIQMAQSELIALQNTDYSTFSAKNPLTLIHQFFCAETAAKIRPILNSSTYLQIAIHTAEIDNIKKYQVPRNITSANEIVGSTLKILYKNISFALNEIDKYLQQVDNYCKNKFDWAAMRTAIQNSYASIFKTENFEDFLKQGE